MLKTPTLCACVCAVWSTCLGNAFAKHEDGAACTSPDIRGAQTRSAVTAVTRPKALRTQPRAVGSPLPVAAVPATSVAATLTKCVEVDWIEVTLDEVVEWLREQGAINVVCRWNALAAEGVDRESFITLRLRNVRIETVLGETLRQLSDTALVRYRTVGEIVYISTKSDFARELYVRVYDATDLMARIASFGNGSPTVEMQNGSGDGNQPAVTWPGSAGDDDQAEEELEARIGALAEVIERMIEPRSWEAVGGPGAIAWYKRSLVVRNTIEVHEQIAGLFEME